MQKLLLLPILALLFITACQKENVATTASSVSNATIDSRSPNKVFVCHHGKIKEIPINALPDHLAHGDVQLIDADGDGWATTVNECMPGGDCNDNDAGTHPDAEEVCGDNQDNNCNGQTDEGCCNNPCFNEETLNGGSDFDFYYDSKIANCDLEYILVSVQCPQFVAYVWEPSPRIYLVYYANLADGECVYYVGEGEGYISKADFDCSAALLRAFIAAHPEIPNYCDGLKSGDGSSSMVRPEELLKNLMPENLRNRLDK